MLNDNIEKKLQKIYKNNPSKSGLAHQTYDLDHEIRITL